MDGRRGPHGDQWPGHVLVAFVMDLMKKMGSGRDRREIRNKSFVCQMPQDSTWVSVGLSVLFREQCRPPAGKDFHRTGAPWRKTGFPHV